MVHHELCHRTFALRIVTRQKYRFNYFANILDCGLSSRFSREFGKNFRWNAEKFPKLAEYEKFVFTLNFHSKEKAFRFLNSLHFAINASNIGDVRTLVVHTASTIFFQSDAQEKKNAGATDDLVRVNVGIEDIADLIADFEGALLKI